MQKHQPGSSRLVVEAKKQLGIVSGSCSGGKDIRESKKGDDAAISSALKEIVAWGICDLKFDPLLGCQERVKVLELGDGRSSRFSQHGVALKDYFDANYSLAAQPLARTLLMENKILVDAAFRKAGFQALRPTAATYPRRYLAGLADAIRADLSLESDDDIVVLKLANRSRGAGVVVLKASALDDTLRHLLCTPSSSEEWESWAAVAIVEPWESRPYFEEQCRHWWSNECPNFLAERCCHSLPERLEGGSDTFDGTMRVGFVIELQQDGALGVEWLGGYWKMPPQPLESPESEGRKTWTSAGLEDVLVSSFNSVAKRTAPVSPVHLEEVYRILGPALLAVLHEDISGPAAIDGLCEQEPLMKAFVACRSSSVLRQTDVKRSWEPLKQARALCEEASRNGLGERNEFLSLCSYVDRTWASTVAVEGDWIRAATLWSESLTSWHFNATTHFLLGWALLERREGDDAKRHLLLSIALDPDFKLSYLALANYFFMERDFLSTLKVALACLRHFPDAPPAHFAAGQAIYHALTRAPPSGSKLGLGSKDDKELAVAGRKALELAKVSEPGSWCQACEGMLQYLTKPSLNPTRQPVRLWRVHSWRP